MDSSKLLLRVIVAVVLFGVILYRIRWERTRKTGEPQTEMGAYTEAEARNFEKKARALFGGIETVFHHVLFFLEDVHVDIYLFKPDPETKNIRLLSCGMGACRMAVPPEDRNEFSDRIELSMELPGGYEYDRMEDGVEGKEMSVRNWPVTLLSRLAHLPISENTWLGSGHTLDWERGVDDVPFDGFLFLEQEAPSEKIRVAPRKRVGILHVVPLYQEELDYAEKFDPEKLLEHWGEDPDFTVTRKNTFRHSQHIEKQ